MNEKIKEEICKLKKFIRWLEENYPNVIDEYFSETGGK